MTDQDFLEQFQIVFEKMDQMSRQMFQMSQRMDQMSQQMATKDELAKLESKLTAKIDAVESSLRQEMISIAQSLNSSIISKTVTDDDIERIANRAAVMAGALIENKLGKRIDSLTDGYTLNYEKQYALEQRVDVLERAVEDLRVRVAY